MSLERAPLHGDNPWAYIEEALYSAPRAVADARQQFGSPESRLPAEYEELAQDLSVRAVKHYLRNSKNDVDESYGVYQGIALGHLILNNTGLKGGVQFATGIVPTTDKLIKNNERYRIATKAPGLVSRSRLLMSAAAGAEKSINPRHKLQLPSTGIRMAFYMAGIGEARKHETARLAIIEKELLGEDVGWYGRFNAALSDIDGDRQFLDMPDYPPDEPK